MVNEKKTFLLGIYTNPEYNSAAVLQTLKDDGINAVLSYNDYSTTYLDNAAKLGMYAIIDVNELTSASNTAAIATHVNQLKDHAATFGWYTVDEVYDLPQIKNAYTTVRANDTTHPIIADEWMNLTGYKLSDYNPYYNAFGYDEYPVGQEVEQTNYRNMTTCNNYIMTNVPESSIAHFYVSQVYNLYAYDYGTNIEPTLQQKRLQPYLAFCAGIKNILLFSYFDIMRPSDATHGTWTQAAINNNLKDLHTLGLELSDVGNTVILNGTPFNLAKSTNADLLAIGYETPDAYYVIVANQNVTSQQSITVSLPSTSWTMQDASVMYGNLILAKVNTTLQITAGTRESGTIKIAKNATTSLGRVHSHGAPVPGINFHVKRYDARGELLPSDKNGQRLDKTSFSAP